MVPHVSATAGKFALACLVVFGCAAVAGLGMSLSSGSLRSATPSPAEIVASRFPSAEDSLNVVPATFSTVSVMPVEHWEMFRQGSSFPQAAADPAWSTSVGVIEPTASEPAQPPAMVGTATPEPPQAPAANASPRRGAGRSGSVLNDAQIASIKRRLNLTAEQEQMWPAVETALRQIVYTRNASDPKARAQASGARMAYIDPGSAEVQQLKSAALPLIMRLNDEQKREVKMLAYVMGLEAMAARF